jgi:hypothetical protein
MTSAPPGRGQRRAVDVAPERWHLPDVGRPGGCRLGRTSLGDRGRCQARRLGGASPREDGVSGRRVSVSTTSSAVRSYQPVGATRFAAGHTPVRLATRDADTRPARCAGRAHPHARRLRRPDVRHSSRERDTPVSHRGRYETFTTTIVLQPNSEDRDAHRTEAAPLTSEAERNAVASRRNFARYGLVGID